MLFEEAVFALEAAFGTGLVTQQEVVHFDFVRGPVERREALALGEIEVVIALGADAVPLGLGGFVDEIVFESVRGGPVGLAEAVQKELPGFYVFAREDEGLGATAVFEGVLGRDGATFRRSGAGAARVAFFGCGSFAGGERRSGLDGRAWIVDFGVEKHDF